MVVVTVERRVWTEAARRMEGRDEEAVGRVLGGEEEEEGMVADGEGRGRFGC